MNDLDGMVGLMNQTISRPRRLAPLLAALAVLAAAAPAAAQSRVRVAILEPGPFDAVSGEVRVVIGVEAAEPVARVELYVDGRLLTTLAEPPWEATVELGPQNEEHVFRAVAYGASGARGEMSLETPAIEVDEVMELPLQQLYVTVTRGADRVTTLSRESFRVVDAGEVQQLVTFEGGDAPLTAVLLVDSSQSMRGERLQAAIRGAQAFTAGMKELDEAMAILFADRLLRATPFTDDPEELRSLLEGVEAGGGTALTDHLYAAFKILDGRQGRRVVVVLSDGFDVYSGLRMKDVLWKAQRSQAIVYWIQLKDQVAAVGSEPGLYLSSWRDAEANREEYETLRRLVLETGGRIQEIERIGEVESAFQSILAELRDQYVLGYYPTDLRRDGSWRQVQVRVRGVGNSARVREGYVDF
jgi:Ca-activated chloride channel family protein